MVNLRHPHNQREYGAIISFQVQEGGVFHHLKVVDDFMQHIIIIIGIINSIIIVIISCQHHHHHRLNLLSPIRDRDFINLRHALVLSEALHDLVFALHLHVQGAVTHTLRPERGVCVDDPCVP